MSLSTDPFSDDSPLVPGGRHREEANFDITAMIDLVFMMNIFFLVTMVSAALNELDLPSSSHCIPVDEEASIVISILKGPADSGDARVFLGSGESGRLLSSLSEQEDELRAAIETGIASGKDTVLIQAEKNVTLREIAQTGRIVAAIQNIRMKLAVIEEQ